MSALSDYRILCCREQWQNGLRSAIDCVDDRLQLTPGYHLGVCCLPPVDSGERGFCWSRLCVQADLPQDCGLRLYVHSADSPDWSAWDALRAACETSPDTVSQQVRTCFGPPAASGPDCWLTLNGRYLWVAFELTATGGSLPSVHAFRLRMGGDHMLDYLPAIYQGDGFTLRYLSIFQSMFQDLEDQVEALPRQLDAAGASRDMLHSLAQWVCMDDDTTEEQTRSRLFAVLDEYETMYTRAGILRSVQRLTGHRPMLIEHFSVDPNRADCRNPTLYRRLYGTDPYRFFVLLDEDVFASRDQMKWFLTRLRELVPAGTEPELILLKPCVQLDWHTYLGINSRVGGYVPAVIDERMTIHYDTTIGGSEL